MTGSRLGFLILLLVALVPSSRPRAFAAAADPGEPTLSTPRVRPWVPPGFDSLQTWVAQARAEFREQPRDSIDAETIVPYNRVSAIASRWLRSLGPAAASHSRAVEGALDSLGFDTEIVNDPVLPDFMLLVVRNPFRLTASAMGIMYWRRGDRVLQQGFELHGGQAPQMRAWWNGERDAPYKWAILDRSREQGTRIRFFLFRLTADGGMWRPAQFEGRGPDLGDAHTAGFEDLNGDGLPEVVAWSQAPSDTLFEACTGCPRRLIESVYAERKDEGFVLHDRRPVPAPYSMFVLFIRHLVDHNRAAAARMLAQPAKVDEAIGWGWGARRAPGTWKLELSEDERWPRWMQFRFRGSRGVEHYVVRFTQKDGQWIIEDWKLAARPVTRGTRK